MENGCRCEKKEQTLSGKNRAKVPCLHYHVETLFLNGLNVLKTVKLSIEISMYPLTETYEPPILDFIAGLQEKPGIRVMTNTMSTQIFGEYDALMSLMTEEIKMAFERSPTTVMVLKLINANLEPTE